MIVDLPSPGARNWTEIELVCRAEFLKIGTPLGMIDEILTELKVRLERHELFEPFITTFTAPDSVDPAVVHEIAKSIFAAHAELRQRSVDAIFMLVFDLVMVRHGAPPADVNVLTSDQAPPRLMLVDNSTDTPSSKETAHG